MRGLKTEKSKRKRKGWYCLAGIYQNHVKNQGKEGSEGRDDMVKHTNLCVSCRGAMLGAHEQKTTVVRKKRERERDFD